MAKKKMTLIQTSNPVRFGVSLINSVCSLSFNEVGIAEVEEIFLAQLLENDNTLSIVDPLIAEKLQKEKGEDVEYLKTGILTLQKRNQELENQILILQEEKNILEQELIKLKAIKVEVANTIEKYSTTTLVAEEEEKDKEVEKRVKAAQAKAKKELKKELLTKKLEDLQNIAKEFSLPETEWKEFLTIEDFAEYLTNVNR